MTFKLEKLHCFYHNEKGYFGVVAKELKPMLGIPRTCLSRLAMAICSCRKKTDKRTSFEEMIQQDEYENIGDSDLLYKLFASGSSSNNAMSQGSYANANGYISNAIKYKSLGNESATRLVIILKMASRKNYKYLCEEMIGQQQQLDSTSSDNEQIATTTIEAKEKGSVSISPLKNDVIIYKNNSKRACRSHEIRFILQKRKRQADTMTRQTLPMFGGSVKTLYRTKNIGEKFCALSAKCKPCVIEMDFEATGERMRQNMKMTIIKIWCKRMHLPIIVRTLTDAARKVQETNDAIHRQQKQFRRPWDSKKGHDSCEFNQEFPPHLKEIRKSNFSRKQHSSHKKSKVIKQKQLRKNRKSDTSFSVRCYNCHIELENLPHRYNNGWNLDNPPSLACKYHPGYLMDANLTTCLVNRKVWSCCGQGGESDGKSFAHAQNGCQQGPHMWRYQTKKVSNIIEDLLHLQSSNHICI